MAGFEGSSSVPLRFEMSRLGVPSGESSRDSIHRENTSHEVWLNARSEKIDEHFFFCCSAEGDVIFEFGDISLQRKFFRDVGGNEPVSGFTLDVGVYERGLELLDKIGESPKVWDGSF